MFFLRRCNNGRTCETGGSSRDTIHHNMVITACSNESLKHSFNFHTQSQFDFSVTLQKSHKEPKYQASG